MHVEPTLSEDQMDVVNALLSQPGREHLTTLSPYLEPGTTWYFLILVNFFLSKCLSFIHYGLKSNDLFVLSCK